MSAKKTLFLLTRGANLNSFLCYVCATKHLSLALGSFLTAMTFHSIHVEFYLTKISFLTAFFSVCVRALKTPCLLPRGDIFIRFLAVYVSAKKARFLLKRNLNIMCAVFKRNLNMMC